MKRLILGAPYDKKIEFRTVRERDGVMLTGWSSPAELLPRRNGCTAAAGPF